MPKLLGRRRQTKEQLQQQIEEMFAIMDGLEGGVYITDMQTYEILRVNRYIEKFFGENIIGKKCYEVFQEGQDKPCPFCTNNRLLIEGKPGPPVVWEFQNTRNGLWYHCIDRAIHWPDGRIVRMEIAIDITERKKSEEEIRLLSESAHKLLEIKEPDDRYDYILKRMLELTGAKVGYVSYIDEKTGYLVAPTLTRDVWEVCQVRGKDIVFKEFTGLWGWGLKNKQPVLCNDIKNDKRSKPPPEGHIEIKNFLSVPCVIKDKIAGQIGLANKKGGFTEEDLMLVEKHAGLLTIAIEKHRAEIYLRESEERYRSVFEGVADGVFVSTPEGRFLSVNPAMVNIFGYDSVEEMLAVEDIRETFYFNPEDRDKIMKIYEEEGLIKGYEVEFKKKDGTRITALLTSFAVRDEKGNPIRYEGIVKDITDKKRLEAQLIHAQKMEAVGLLAGGIAHHFNNLLTAILGYVSLLQESLPDDSQLRTYVDNILQASKGATALTSSLLAHSRRQTMTPMPVKLGGILQGIKKILSKIIGEDIELRIFVSPDEVPIMADQAQIEQVLMNLCTNARDAMPRGGILTIRAEPVEFDEDYVRSHGFGSPGRYMLISVSDTGMGIDKETRERIFEPFFTTKDVGRATGLGLAISYGIIKQHNGHINVSSEIGKGTTFRIYLPAI